MGEEKGQLTPSRRLDTAFPCPPRHSLQRAPVSGTALNPEGGYRWASLSPWSRLPRCTLESEKEEVGQPLACHSLGSGLSWVMGPQLEIRRQEGPSLSLFESETQGELCAPAQGSLKSNFLPRPDGCLPPVIWFLASKPPRPPTSLFISRSLTEGGDSLWPEKKRKSTPSYIIYFCYS